MTKMRKAGFTTAAASATLATLVLPSAFAGTGGTDNAGILYGQDAAHCDAQGGTILKTDSGSGQALEGATFQFANAATPLGTLGVKFYTSELDAATISADRIAWQEAFDESLAEGFDGTAYGTAWLAASVKTAEGVKPKAGSDSDSTTYTTSETALFPADITAITNPSARSAAMSSWVNMAAPNGGSTVSAFFTAVKSRLDAVGAVVVSGYDASAPTDPATMTVHANLVGTDSETTAVAEYTKAYNEFMRLQAAIEAAGYTNASFTGTTVTFGNVNVASQDWAAFVAAYDAMTAAGAYSFGLVPPTYDVIYNAVGTAGIETAEAAANTAVAATPLADGGSATSTTNSTGEIYYAVFGRTVTEVGGTMDKTCAHLALEVTETVAPDGYLIDDPDAKLITPASLEDAISNNEWTDTLDSGSVTPDNPTPPEFESGL